MKRPRFFPAAGLSIFCAVIAAVPSLFAQAEATAPTPAPAAPGAAGSTTAAAAAAPDAISPELQKKMQDVMDAFTRGNYDDALAKLADAQKMRPNEPELFNLQGAIYVKEEKWQQALDSFGKALAINPKYFPARFDSAEVLYLEKKYPDARAAFEKLESEDPRNELIQYKVYLTYLLEGNLTEAKTLLDKFDFTGNTPAYYYAQAAWYYNQKNTPEAESYIASAIQIFPPQSNNLFAESLMDAGWLKRKTAADEAAEAAGAPPK